MYSRSHWDACISPAGGDAANLKSGGGDPYAAAGYGKPSSLRRIHDDVESVIITAISQLSSSSQATLPAGASDSDSESLPVTPSRLGVRLGVMYLIADRQTRGMRNHSIQ
jgi:hypothetical protein